MNADEMELYDEFVRSSPQGSIFSNSWWLDAVAPGRYEILTVKRGDNIAAAMPIVKNKVLGHTVIARAPLTKFLGILYRTPSAKQCKRLSEEKRIAEELLEQLPGNAYFSQNFHYNFTNWLPLYWRGFQQSTKYTYVFEDLSDLDRIWNGMRENIRKDIRKAQKSGITVRTGLGIDRFLDIQEMTFRRQGRTFEIRRDVIYRLHEACLKRDASRIFYAVDGDNRVHAANYIVWDDRSAYAVLGGADPGVRNSGATSLVLWEAIRFASTVTGAFDFQGSMVEPIERVFRAFGAEPKAYFHITRTSSRLMATALALRGLFRGATKQG